MNDFSLNRQKHKNIQRRPEKQFPNLNPKNKKLTPAVFAG